MIECWGRCCEHFRPPQSSKTPRGTIKQTNRPVALLTSSRLLGSASTLLTTLTNPLNVTLLTSQTLSAPAVWAQPEGLRTSTRTLSVFHSAAQALLRHEDALTVNPADTDLTRVPLDRCLPRPDWIKAVINGADEKSPRWRHVLVLGGLLLGFGPVEDEKLSRSMRSTLEQALISATNLALAEMDESDELAQQSITFVLNHGFPILSDYERSRLDYDALLPCLLRSTFLSGAGLESGYFLRGLDRDVMPVSNNQFGWSERSDSFHHIREKLASPLVSSLGPLCRLIGHSVDNAKQPWLVTAILPDLEAFARTLHTQWRQTQLSEVDPAEYSVYLDKETFNTTTPQLWKLLKSTLFGVVIVLRSIIGRTLSDPALAGPESKHTPSHQLIYMLMSLIASPIIATQSLQTLRSLYFISARAGASSFSQYTFVNLTAMDILSAFPLQSQAFIESIRPAEHKSGVPEHPLDRNLDLFFLNLAEHFTLVLPTQLSQDLLIPAASPYLAAGGNNNLLPIFEAAHSVMLAIFSASHNADLTAKYLPFYIDALFNCFPHNLTARQFRLAFKTLLRLASPPATLAATEPMLSATLLELLFDRARHASTYPIFPLPQDENAEAQAPAQLSEQAVVALIVIDTLPELPLDLLEETLPIAAQMANGIENGNTREYCKEQFWQSLVGGEMDPDRSELCHAWWSTRGGRDLLLFGERAEARDDLKMSGALPDEPREHKL